MDILIILYRMPKYTVESSLREKIKKIFKTKKIKLYLLVRK